MKCWVCGKEGADCTRDIEAEYKLFFEIPTRQLVENEHQRVYCKKCYAETMKKLRQENELFTQLKRKRTFEHAIDKMERQQINFAEYEEAIKTIEDYNFKNDGKFDSSEEIMAAIVLIHNHYHIKPQTKIGCYQVDFMLPDDYIILEIDGIHHKLKKGYDSERDRNIKEKLGDKWQIIRIPTELIDEDVTKLPQAIEKVLDYRDTHKVNWRSL